jgi:Tfp pilus assembly protein PilV
MPMNRKGLGLPELIVSMVIISVVVISLGAVLPNSMRNSTQAHVDFLALNAVDDRLALIRMDPRFPRPADEWEEENTPLPDLPGLLRTTTVEEVEGLPLQDITVRVTAPNLRGPVERTVRVGEP